MIQHTMCSAGQMAVCMDSLKSHNSRNDLADKSLLHSLIYFQDAWSYYQMPPPHLKWEVVERERLNKITIRARQVALTVLLKTSPTLF